MNYISLFKRWLQIARFFYIGERPCCFFETPISNSKSEFFDFSVLLLCSCIGSSLDFHWCLIGSPFEFPACHANRPELDPTSHNWKHVCVFKWGNSRESKFESRLKAIEKDFASFGYVWLDEDLMKTVGTRSRFEIFFSSQVHCLINCTTFERTLLKVLWGWNWSSKHKVVYNSLPREIKWLARHITIVSKLWSQKSDPNLVQLIWKSISD